MNRRDLCHRKAWEMGVHRIPPKARKSEKLALAFFALLSDRWCRHGKDGVV